MKFRTSWIGELVKPDALVLATYHLVRMWRKWQESSDDWRDSPSAATLALVVEYRVQSFRALRELRQAMLGKVLLPKRYAPVK